MSKTWTQRALLNWRWWICLVPLGALFIATVAFVGIPWGLWCAAKAGAEAFADGVMDPPFPAEMTWLRKLNKWIREGGQG